MWHTVVKEIVLPNHFSIVVSYFDKFPVLDHTSNLQRLPLLEKRRLLFTIYVLRYEVLRELISKIFFIYSIILVICLVLLVREIVKFALILVSFAS